MKHVVQLIIVSDLHTCKDNVDLMIEKMEQLARLTGTENLNTSDVVLVVAGDITNRGERSEFEDVAVCFDAFAECVRTQKQSVNIHYVFAPGNHDINLTTNQELYECIIKGGISNAHDNVKDRQNQFFEFESERLGLPEPENRVHWQRLIPLDAVNRLNFNVINTSCLTYLEQQKGCFKMPLEYVYQDVDARPDDITITVMHHPLSWLDDNQRHVLIKKIRKHSCMLITGHEHTEDNFTETSEGGELMHIECGVYGSWNQKESYAISAYLEIEEKGNVICNRFLYHWDGEKFLYTDALAPVCLKRNKYVEGYSLSSRFSEWLDELPNGLKHTTVGELKFDDVYVDRRLRYTDGSGSTLKTIDSDVVISDDAPSNRSIVTGEDASGKTVLAKNYVKKLFANGKVPLYFEGGKVNARDMVKVLQDAYREQYGERRYDEYLKIDFESRAIVIDDFEKMNLKGITRADFLKTLKDSFSVVIIFADESEYINFSSDAKVFTEISNSYAVYKLLELSPKAINKMVEKWNSIDRHEDLSFSSIEERNLDMQAKLQRLTGKSLVPRYPGYILLFMYALTNESESSRMMQIGTYGSLYEILIRKQLADATTKQFDLQSLSSYLEELAFCLFKKNSKQISEEEYYEFARAFNREHATLYSASSFLNMLIRAEIIRETSDYQDLKYFYFAYDYYYYYFVAKYFSNNIAEDEVRQYVQELCNGFSDIRKANIWLFLTHVSRDKFIISTLCEWADSLFSGVPESRFDHDIDFIEKLRRCQKELTFNDRDYKEVKQERLSQAEENSENGITEDPTEAEIPDGAENGGVVVELMKAYRTIDILGQLLRNFTGSLKGNEKIRLLKTTYRLSLRTIEFMVAHFRSISDEFIEQLAECTHGLNEEISKEAAAAKFADFFHDLFMGFSYFILNKAAVAVAHEQLVGPYDSAIESIKSECDEGKVSNALTLLHSMVKLTATKQVLETLQGDSWNSISKRPFCKGIFSHAVLRFCYTHPVERVTKEKVCAILGVKYISMLVHRQ